MSDPKPIAETSHTHQSVRHKFPRLPWLVGAVALLVYAATLCHGTSIAGLRLTEQVCGWSEAPPREGPLLWLVTAPFRLLPAGWIPLALNLQSAVFAAVNLALLARCVQLLPLNRLRLQRMFLRNSSGLFERQDAWLPPVLAAAVCGLDGGFWQEAVSATGGMLDLLLVALAIWCFLEFRVSENRRWLDGLALAWGLGMAQNCFMIAAWPLMIAALIWQLRLGVFSLQLWVRSVVGWGLGLATLLTIPLVDSLGPDAPWTFLHAARETALGIWQPLSQAWNLYSGSLWIPALMVGICCALPVVPMLFLLKKDSSYHTSLQARIELVTFQTVFLGFFLLELWVALHPVAGPHNLLVLSHLPPAPLLCLVFLNALGAGYLYAHFLVICGVPLEKLRRRNAQFRLPPYMPEWSRRAAMPLLFVLPVVMTAALTARNLTPVRDLNHTPFRQFAQWTAESLPPDGGVVVSDDPERLRIFRTGLARRPDHRQWAVVDINRLPDPAYRAKLERQFPFGWTANAPKRTLSAPETTLLLVRLVQHHPVYYLHHSFGLFFEFLDAQPHGLVWQLSPAPARFAPAPALTPALQRENEEFWDRAWTNALAGLPARTATPPPPKGRMIRQLLNLAPPDHRLDQLPANWFSAGLNSWGVTLQRNQQWSAAARRFQEAADLNTNNLSARLNLAYNRSRTPAGPGGKAPPAPAENLPFDLMAVQSILRACGPLDTPATDYSLGILFHELGLARQAIQLMDRAVELVPDNLSPQFALAELFVHDHQGPQAEEIVRHLRQKPAHPLNASETIRLDLLAAAALLANTNQTAADHTIQTMLRNHPADGRVLNTALEIYEQAGQLTNALALLQGALAQTPDNVPLLRRAAALQEKTGQYAAALQTLNHALQLTNNFSLRLDRAANLLMSGNLAAAETEYRQLKPTAPAAELWHLDFGLAQIALQRNDSATALTLLKTAYAEAPTGSEKQALIGRQIQQLQAPPAESAAPARPPG